MIQKELDPYTTYERLYIRKRLLEQKTEAMSIRLYSYFFLLLAAAGCKKEEPQGVPPCIQAKINEIAKQPPASPPRHVYSYQYQGRMVYYFTDECCDIPSSLYDRDCSLICAPDGGISGQGDGRCPDFFSARQDEKLVWKDERE
jgi:hypothetical protein